jgi:hypothetical protein
VSVQLPAGATVSKATIATDESLRGDRATNGSENGAVARRRGVHVGGDGTSAVAVTIDDAVSATGIALPLLSLAAGTVVSLELQEDFQGSPSGKRLAGGTASLAAPGDAAWATVFFDPVVLPSGPLWLVLRAAKGDAVWIGAPDEGGSVRVVHTADGAAPIATALPGLRALYEVFSRSGDAAARPATSLSVGGVDVAATRDGATATYDFTSALQAALAAGNGAVPLAFASAVAGTVTVHPPHIEYRL